jgi:signal transduction histidine kinase
VVLEVEDSGRGIPPDEVRAVFQRFYRVERGRTPGQGGLGLGLAIVKHLVQRLGGRLELDSREGVGTTVTVRLPRGPAAPGSPGPTGAIPG